MSDILLELGLSFTDLQLLTFFLIAWSGYIYVADYSPLKKQSLAYAMDRHRLRWLVEASSRDMKMVDTGVLRILAGGINFFASATILVLGGIIAAIGYAERIAAAFSHIPFASALSTEAIVMRLGLLLAIFIYAFFKFAWALRIANYCAIVIGGMSDHRYDENDQQRLNRAEVAANLSASSGYHFNRGVRAYFFALASLGWFIGPLSFIAATLGVLIVLIRREFSSNTVGYLRNLE